MNKNIALFLTFLVLTPTLISGCGDKQQAQAASPNGGRPAVPVVVAPVEQRDIPVQLSGIGNAQAYRTVQIRSQVNGQIEKVHFKEGQDVKKGDLLFTLDKSPFQAEVEKAIGTLQKDEAQAANSATQAARYNELEKQGVVAHQLADQQRAQAKADASVVNADKAAVNAARVQLQYTEIRAPLDARAGALLVNQGNVVKANDTTYLVQLNQITPLYVEFSVPESNIDEVRRYAARKLKVLVRPKGQGSVIDAGVLTFIDNGVDPTTGTVKLKGTFPNKERPLLPGQYVDVTLNLSMEKNAIVVPAKAIQQGQQGDYVFVVNQENVAEPRQIKTAGSYQDLAIVGGGVNPGERVIVEGQLRVAPNAKVNPSNAPANGAPASGAATGGGQ
ncbi:MAG: efflux pump, family, rane fusion lipoprotein [Acidobacteriales bacterium]|nr:efflux pump, family, rane fusion lipoprotein [Terriglobales bacterium]